MQSMQQNDHLEITHDYQICNVAGGLAQGLSAKGKPAPAQAMLMSDGFGYKHTLTFRNTSAAPLVNFEFYHLLHSLQGNYSVYDDTDHGGAMAEYRHDFTQRGLSYSFNDTDGGLYAHTDYITAHSQIAPDGFSVGYYGIRGIDRHDIGKPSAGVHFDIETDTFTGVSEFEPDEGGWVAGAARYPLGTIGVGESKSFTLLFSLRTMSELVYKDSGIVLDSPMVVGDKLHLNFNDTNDLVGMTGLGFSLESSTTMDEEFWTPEPFGYIFNPANPGRYSFEIPFNKDTLINFYRIRPIFGF
jgi:hypothetical protein